jgi:hypothetical protein
LEWPSGRTADYQTWRNQRDWTERKYAIWARGEKFQAQTAR